jgi:6-phosphogluconolactonase
MRYKVNTVILLGTFFVLLMPAWLSGQVEGKNLLLFAGSYTDGQPADGIQIFRFERKSGKLKGTGKVGGIVNPSFLTVSANGKFLFACTDTKLEKEGSITAFAIDALHGKLQRLGQQPSGGANPVYVSSHPTGNWIAVANYAESTIAAFPVDQNGLIGPYSQRIPFADSSVYKLRQEKSHPHAAVFSPDGRFLFVPDLGADKIRVFAFESEDSVPLTPLLENTVKTAPASGPRHLTFHPNGHFAYCIEELSGNVTVYRYANGKLDSLQTMFANSTRQTFYSSADIHSSPDGQFIYVSNRGKDENTLAIFRVELVTGLLTFVAHQSTLGEHPRNFCISPDGRFLIVANQISGNLVVLRRNQETGLLTKVGKDVGMKNPSSLWMMAYPQP